MLYSNITQKIPAIIQSGTTAQKVQTNKNIINCYKKMNKCCLGISVHCTTLKILPSIYIYIYIRGGTVRTSVRGSRFDTISVQHEKKRNCSVSFHLF